jgi:hypothetical protein
VLVGAVVAGCTGGSSGPIPITPPSPAPRVATVCGALHDALPRRLDGRLTTPVSPKSALTAAWGDPAVALRCGVGKPATLRPTSQTIDINGVRWFFHETTDAYVFTTYGRVAFVEVRIPKSVPREQATAPLVDLARPVLDSVPAVA